MRVDEDETDPEDLRQDPVRRPRVAAGHAGSANDPAACCRAVLLGLAWMWEPGQN
jgi:hypothetical protein